MFRCLEKIRQRIVTKCVLFHVPDFRVAHEPIAESYGNAVSCQGAVTVVFRDGIHVSGIGRGDCVSLHVFFGGNSPAIVNAADIAS